MGHGAQDVVPGVPPALSAASPAELVAAPIALAVAALNPRVAGPGAGSALVAGGLGAVDLLLGRSRPLGGVVAAVCALGHFGDEGG